MDSKDSKGCLFVGEGVTINGEVSLPGAVFVDGVINGQIKANEVFVGITGQVNGTVSASKADVRGAVGDAIEIHEHITVRASARLQGNVTYRSLEIERGGVIEGQLVCVDEAITPAASLAAPESTSQADTDDGSSESSQSY
jgi:cytoskeletal protein CcmA (bactofilin family)